MLDSTKLDPSAITTPAGLRRAVVAAVVEREKLGDTLAPGILKVIYHLEEQVNSLAWELTGREPATDPAPMTGDEQRAWLERKEVWQERHALGLMSDEDYAAKLRAVSR